MQCSVSITGLSQRGVKLFMVSFTATAKLDSAVNLTLMSTVRGSTGTASPCKPDTEGPHVQLHLISLFNTIFKCLGQRHSRRFFKLCL